MTTDITTQVKNYKGKNSFILKMKDAVSKYGSLTVNQRSAVEKIFNNPVEAKSVEMSDEMKKIASYEGPNSFVIDLKNKLNQYGKLSEKQISAGLKQIEKDENKTVIRKVNVPAIGDTIKVGRKIGQQLKEQYGLNFNPILLDITKVLSFSAKAVKFSGKMTVKRGDVCVCCAKTLTDEFSMLTKWVRRVQNIWVLSTLQTQVRRISSVKSTFVALKRSVRWNFGFQILKSSLGRVTPMFYKKCHTFGLNKKNVGFVHYRTDPAHLV